ncbi:CBS domain-containing protein [Amphritea sp. HPY]|uniref:CBS domain-containing protein n=1 Tax=Amphritea sp. HPY TaxID=3421652 RepID=UPI003D7D7E72
MANLNQITAGDIMSAELLTVADHWSVKALIEFFSKHKVTGAPVLSAEGELAGVVSLSDIIRLDSQPEQPKKDNTLSQYYLATLEGYTPDDLGLKKGDLHTQHLVREIMTPEVISVEDNAALPEVARLMSDKGIHRVFVTSNGGLRGAVSTLDIVRQVAAC